METTNDHILETVCLNLGPVVYLVGGDILRIAGYIVRSIGIGTLSTDGSHQFVILVGDEVLGSDLTDRVNLVVSLLTSLRVSEFTISLIALFYLGKQRSLSSRVVGTELLGALKHQVLQIVSQSCCLSRVVLRTSTHGDISLNTGLFLIDRKEHLQAVVQRINAGLHHVTRDSSILVVLSL